MKLSVFSNLLFQRPPFILKLIELLLLHHVSQGQGTGFVASMFSCSCATNDNQGYRVLITVHKGLVLAQTQSLCVP